ncbi:Predicted protein [Taphrina deformans PYCC 5710]|uniref:Nucleoporin Nup159/Nup146 N-terminal domain-containing protein n=1 Tax=Taphrina deformans (strain PYCC 5710 / ATCC 11124 / CBS 356.35 / IMI 108563 / JCM 9778 / NBRC 8474) TaxID=1097556 RepID=R4XDJ7_TAPDE|nr:Predicted protein [Taphrina deformans PYCC 5710]|eukprot:CCG81419.1 Predicted protein [Taphrina deformans PYCC 5710]
MATSNSFGALSGNTSPWTLKSEETEEYTSQKHGFRALAGDAVLTIGEAFPDGFPETRVQLLAVSQDSYAYATLNHRICVGSISQLQDKLVSLGDKDNKTIGLSPSENEITLETAISHLAFSSNAQQLYVSAKAGGMLVCATNNIQNSQQQVASPALMDLVPNPTDSTIALLSLEGELQLYDENGLAAIASGVSAISWSKRGKQIIVGTTDGVLKQYTPRGELKAELPAVNGAVGKVNAINWLENDLFVIAYENADGELALYILRRDQSGETPTLIYTAISNPSISFGDTSHAPHFSFVSLSKDLVLTMSSVSADFGLISLSHVAAIEIDVEEQKAAVRFSSNRDTDVSIIGHGVQVDEKNSAKYIWYLDNDGGCAAWEIRDTENPLFDAVPAPAKSTSSAVLSTQVAGPSPFDKPVSSDSKNSGTASPFSFTSSGSTPAPLFGGFPTLSVPIGTTSGTSQPAFGSSSAFGTSAFGSTAFGSSTSRENTFGTPSFSAPTAFKGFDNASALGNSNPGSKNTTSAQIATHKTSSEQSRPMPTKSISKATMSDSDEDEMQDDKLAHLGEQEPENIGEKNALPDVTSMDFLSFAHKEGEKDVAELSIDLSATEEAVQTSPVKKVENGAPSDVFGSFSFPSAQFGGFGSLATSNTNSQKHESLTSTSSQIPRPQTTASRPSFGFGELAKNSSSPVPTKSVFGSGEGKPTFGFGSTTRSAALPKEDAQKTTSVETEHKPELEHGSTESPRVSWSELSAKPIVGAENPFYKDEPLKSLPPFNFSQVGDDHDESVSKDNASRHNQDKSETFDVPNTGKQAEKEDLNSKDDNVKHIPPFDFSHVEKQELSQELANNTQLKENKRSLGSNELETVSQQDGINLDHAPFASFSIEEHDSEYDTEEESADSQEKSLEEDYSEDEQDASRVNEKDAYTDEASEQSGFEEDPEGDSNSQLDESDKSDREADSDDDQISAFQPKTPAFASVTKSDLSRPSPFSSSPTVSPFGTQSTIFFNKQPQAPFNFAQAASLSEPASKIPSTNFKAPVFSFNPGSEVPKPEADSPTTFSFKPNTASPAINSPQTNESQALQKSTTLLNNQSQTRSEDQETSETSSTINQSAHEAGTGNEAPHAASTILDTDAKSLKPIDKGQAERAESAAQAVGLQQGILRQKFPETKDNGAHFPGVIGTQQARSQSPTVLAETKGRSPTTPAIKQESESLKMPDYMMLNSKGLDNDNETAIAHELHVLSTTLTSELNVMHENLGKMAQYIDSSQNAAGSLSSIGELTSEVSLLSERAHTCVENQKSSDSQLSSMRSSMLRLEAQKTKVQRLLRAQTDISFAQSLKFSALGPEHAAQQRQIRQLLGNVEKALEKLQSSLSMIKAKNPSSHFQSSAPTAETITRATAKIMQVAVQKERDVDNLQKAFVALQLASPDASFQSSTHLGHRSRRSQARFSIDNTFDLSLSQLSLSQNGTGPSMGLRSVNGGQERSNLMAMAEQKRHAMQVYRESRAKGLPIKTVPM